MKVLFVTSEAAPFAASGGLGDVMGALPAAVASLGENTFAMSLTLVLSRMLLAAGVRIIKNVLLILHFRKIGRQR